MMYQKIVLCRIYKTINVKWVSLPLITETVSFSVSITKHKDPAKLLLSSSSLMKASFLSSNATLCLSRSLLFFFCFNELFLFLFFVLWLNFDSFSRIRLLLCFLSFNFLSPSSSLVPWLELLHLYEIWKKLWKCYLVWLITKKIENSTACISCTWMFSKDST